MRIWNLPASELRPIQISPI